MLLNHMASMLENLTLSNPVFATFAFYSCILLLKVMFMSFWTIRWGMALFHFARCEDYPKIKEEIEKERKATGIAVHPNIGRVRRAHLNDLENILPFILICFLYVLCSPPQYAVWLFRIFTITRVLHTVVYLNEIRPPARGLCFGVGAIINVIMAVQIMLKTVRM